MRYFRIANIAVPVAAVGFVAAVGLNACSSTCETDADCGLGFRCDVPNQTCVGLGGDVNDAFTLKVDGPSEITAGSQGVFSASFEEGLPGDGVAYTFWVDDVEVQAAGASSSFGYRPGDTAVGEHTIKVIATLAQATDASEGEESAENTEGEESAEGEEDGEDADAASISFEASRTVTVNAATPSVFAEVSQGTPQLRVAASNFVVGEVATITLVSATQNDAPLFFRFLLNRVEVLPFTQGAALEDGALGDVGVVVSYTPTEEDLQNGFFWQAELSTTAEGNVVDQVMDTVASGDIVKDAATVVLELNGPTTDVDPGPLGSPISHTYVASLASVSGASESEIAAFEYRFLLDGVEVQDWTRVGVDPADEEEILTGNILEQEFPRTGGPHTLRVELRETAASPTLLGVDLGIAVRAYPTPAEYAVGVRGKSSIIEGETITLTAVVERPAGDTGVLTYDFLPAVGVGTESGPEGVPVGDALEDELANTTGIWVHATGVGFVDNGADPTVTVASRTVTVDVVVKIDGVERARAQKAYTVDPKNHPATLALSYEGIGDDAEDPLSSDGSEFTLTIAVADALDRPTTSVDAYNGVKLFVDGTERATVLRDLSAINNDDPQTFLLSFERIPLGITDAGENQLECGEHQVFVQIQDGDETIESNTLQLWVADPEGADPSTCEDDSPPSPL